MTPFLVSLRNVSSRSTQTIKTLKLAWLIRTRLLNRIKVSTKLLWEEGLYVDFIQKKSTDKLIRKVIVLTLNTFSERLVFDKLVLTIPNLIVRWAHFFNVFELKSVASLVTITLITVSLLLLLNLLNVLSAATLLSLI